ncbi:MAG: hypothetical protein WA672_05585 [Candidatus Angelobacter sp.]
MSLSEMDSRLDDGRLIRQSANTRNWEKAELTARALEDSANPHKPAARTRVTISDAIQCFRDDERSRHLSKDSNRKSAFFFETQLKTWAEKQGFAFLEQLTAAKLTKFRGQWGNGPTAEESGGPMLCGQGKQARHLLRWQKKSSSYFFRCKFAVNKFNIHSYGATERYSNQDMIVGMRQG